MIDYYKKLKEIESYKQKNGLINIFTLMQKGYSYYIEDIFYYFYDVTKTKGKLDNKEIRANYKAKYTLKDNYINKTILKDLKRNKEGTPIKPFEYIFLDTPTETPKIHIDNLRIYASVFFLFNSIEQNLLDFVKAKIRKNIISNYNREINKSGANEVFKYFIDTFLNLLEQATENTINTFIAFIEETPLIDSFSMNSSNRNIGELKKYIEEAITFFKYKKNIHETKKNDIEEELNNIIKVIDSNYIIDLEKYTTEQLEDANFLNERLSIIDNNTRIINELINELLTEENINRNIELANTEDNTKLTPKEIFIKLWIKREYSINRACFYNERIEFYNDFLEENKDIEFNKPLNALYSRIFDTERNIALPVYYKNPLVKGIQNLILNPHLITDKDTDFLKKKKQDYLNAKDNLKRAKEHLEDLERELKTTYDTDKTSILREEITQTEEDIKLLTENKYKLSERLIDYEGLIYYNYTGVITHIVNESIELKGLKNDITLYIHPKEALEMTNLTIVILLYILNIYARTKNEYIYISDTLIADLIRVWKGSKANNSRFTLRDYREYFIKEIDTLQNVSINIPNDNQKYLFLTKQDTEKGIGITITKYISEKILKPSKLTYVNGNIFNNGAQEVLMLFYVYGYKPNQLTHEDVIDITNKNKLFSSDLITNKKTKLRFKNPRRDKGIDQSEDVIETLIKSGQIKTKSFNANGNATQYETLATGVEIVNPNQAHINQMQSDREIRKQRIEQRKSNLLKAEDKRNKKELEAKLKK